MAITRAQAQQVVARFRAEYKGLAGLRYVFLGSERDFHEHYGQNAVEVIQAWGGNLAAYERRTRTIVLAVAAHTDEEEVERSLAHEGIGHSGINTFSVAEKRALLNAIMDAGSQPGALQSIFWRRVELAYPVSSRQEQADEVFCLMAEQALRPSRYEPRAFQHAWQHSVVERSETLKAWGLAQIVEHVAQGLRDNIRPHRIFPQSDFDQFRGCE
jgi:putative DNA primase/helicase